MPKSFLIFIVFFGTVSSNAWAQSDCRAIFAESTSADLFIAIEANDVALVEDLLENPKVDINELDALEKTPFQAALFGKNSDIVKAFLTSPRLKILQSDLHYAYHNSSLENLSLVLRSERYDINAVDGRGNTVLHFAVRDTPVDEPSAAVTRILNVSNVDFSILNKRGETAIELARERGNATLVRAMIEILKRRHERESRRN